MRMVSASAAAAPALLAFAFAGALMPAIAVAADNPPPDVPPASQGSARPRAPVAPADDITLALAVADALVGAKIGGVQIEAREGRITLKGKVESTAVVQRALRAAQGVAGVREVENRLVSADSAGQR